MTAKAAAKEATELCLALARELGFARAGVTGVEAPARYQAYKEWLGRGDEGSMSYMADEFHQRSRANVRELLPGARSALVVALSYDKAQPETARRHESEESCAPSLGRVAQYAVGDDYHLVFRAKLQTLVQAIEDKLGHPVGHRVCVDSAPVLEREFAERAGLGFVAKNTMLISPGLGSYTLLGVLLLDLEMRPTPPRQTRDCGTCTACLDACPTSAFRAPYQLDSRRCVSYLTIESKEPIPEELREKIGDRIFGCDVCQDVCPYNARAPLRHQTVPELRARDPQRARPSLPLLANLGSNQRKRYTAGTPLRRSNRQQLLRNIAVALGNQEKPSPEQIETLEILAEDRNAMVREHAQWALARTRSSDV